MVGMVILCLCLSGVMLWGACAIARIRLGLVGAMLFTLMAIVPFNLMAIFPLMRTMGAVLFLNGLLLLAATVICLAVRAGPNAYRRAAIEATVVSYVLSVLMVGISWTEFRERAERVQQLQKVYPLESLADRLSYESEVESGWRQQSPDVVLSPEAASRLVDLEERLSAFGGDRRGMLALLHVQTRSRFVLAQGFGVGRMATVRKESLEFDDAEPIPLSAAPEEDSLLYDVDATPREPMDAPLDDHRRRAELSSMHLDGLEDFFDSQAMGYVKDRDHVSGFEPHGFRKTHLMEFDDEADVKWQVTRLELVSLLKYESPAVYVSSHLPRMDELADASTRTLTSFEERALGKLRSDDNIVVEYGANRIWMVGSLRAGGMCIECHTVERGELLGAFSYELHRTPPISQNTATGPAT